MPRILAPKPSTSSAPPYPKRAAAVLPTPTQGKKMVHWYGMPVTMVAPETKAPTNYSIAAILRDQHISTKDSCAALMILQNSKEQYGSLLWYANVLSPAIDQLENDLMAGKITCAHATAVRHHLLNLFRTYSFSAEVKKNIMHSFEAIDRRLLQILHEQQVSVDASGLRNFAAELIPNLRYGYALEKFKNFIVRYASSQLPYLYTWNTEPLEKYNGAIYLDYAMKKVEQLKQCVFDHKQCLRTMLTEPKSSGSVLARLEMEKTQFIADVIEVYFSIPEFSFLTIKNFPIIDTLPVLKERALRYCQSIKRDFKTYFSTPSVRQQKQYSILQKQAEESAGEIFTLFEGLNLRFSLLRDMQQLSSSSAF